MCEFQSDCQPSNSLEPTKANNDELQELREQQGIKVWGTNQQTLENQALIELDLFTKANLEDGEIMETSHVQKHMSLDINSYIKRQEELKKRQVYNKSLLLSDKSKEIPNKIAKQKVDKGKRRKIDTKLDSGSEYAPSDDDFGSDYEEKTSKRRKKTNVTFTETEKVKDDGCLKSYKMRLKEYYEKLEPDMHHTLEGGLKIPNKTWNNLYSYQQEGLEWLWNIHQKSTGCILGDEMGLGKTVQIIAFLQSLEYSLIKSKYGHYTGLGPTIVVCPATVIYQWVKHFHIWAPEFRVAILHQTGSYQGNKLKLIKEINANKGILVTTYSSILKYQTALTDYNWHYLVLDEGHKVRNASAKITIAVKQIRTPFRIILTGCPMQNNLQELWSLFDFTNPGLLGNSQIFLEHFVNPIVQGGFTNASPMQEMTALTVATTLKNLITPFLLRRSKIDVQDCIHLPDKTEQVLFCSLTDEQRDLYKGYLMSDVVGTILGKETKRWFIDNQMKSNVLVAITNLRKICNHPDLYVRETNDLTETVEDEFGFYKKSGKMIVVSALLKIWKKQKHRVLLFTQGKAMLTIFEKFLQDQQYKYLKMDGSTAISSRQPLITKFNQDSTYDVFLLTTRVGGLGVNLTGANRVIIFDPDWNPATDTQARERAWRIGQDKQVTIYRLLSAGTIEEKMYQRQIWKQLLTNKVLLDPKTHRFFKSSNLHDLFTLPEININPETANIFKESRVKIQERMKKKSKFKAVPFSDDKIKEMKDLAQKIAKSLTETKEETKKSVYQVELEEEREKRLKVKEELKKLTPLEIMHFNRNKDTGKEEDLNNKVDDCDTSVSFDKALEYSENTAKLYNKLKSEKIQNKPVKQKEEFKNINNGIVDGELVEGLVKSEVKKIKKKYKKSGQDEYVLEKLFQKKGVSGALQHDSVVESGVRTQSLKIRNEAKLQADKALEALRKSKLNNWRW